LSLWKITPTQRKKALKSLEESLRASVAFHGEACPGQVIGTRMALCGCRTVGIEDPEAERKKLIVFVEMDRCAADAVMAITGCRVGKRTMKIMDYGIMAATFLNLETGKAFRVRARECARERALLYAPSVNDKYAQQREAYKVMPEEELFEISEVHVSLPPQDRPGRSVQRVRCEQCGDWVQDMREVKIDGRILCHPCAYGGYFERMD
jgi:formylmethanofuran dehydrogenase subunit E